MVLEVQGEKHLSDIIMHNRVQSFTELQNKFTLTNQEFFRYLQLKNWITENFNLHYDLVPGPLKDVLFKVGKKKQLICRIYNMLLKEQSKHYSLHKFYDEWNKDLSFKEANIKWKKCLYWSVCEV